MDRLIPLFAGLFLAGCATRRDYRGIIHCHTKYSHDSTGTYEEILAAAKAAKVDFVIITDHPPDDDPGRPLREGWRGLRAGVLFIQGAELPGNILAVGIRDPILARDRQGMVDEIHAQGGLAFVCHPEEVTDWTLRGLDGMEVYNVHAALKRKMKDPRFLGEAAKLLKEEPELVFLPLAELDPEIVARWRSLRIAGIAGNDAHRNVNFLGVQVDPYERAFRFVSTHVLATELTEAAVLDALRSHRCYVQFERVYSIAAGLSWVGRTFPRGSEIEVPETGWGGFTTRITWYRNGIADKPTPCDTEMVGGSRRYRLDRPGTYWLEIHHNRDHEYRPWIVSGPVVIR